MIHQCNLRFDLIDLLYVSVISVSIFDRNIIKQNIEHTIWNIQNGPIIGGHTNIMMGNFND